MLIDISFSSLPTVNSPKFINNQQINQLAEKVCTRQCGPVVGFTSLLHFVLRNHAILRNVAGYAPVSALGLHKRRFCQWMTLYYQRSYSLYFYHFVLSYYFVLLLFFFFVFYSNTCRLQETSFRCTRSEYKWHVCWY